LRPRDFGGIQDKAAKVAHGPTLPGDSARVQTVAAPVDLALRFDGISWSERYGLITDTVEVNVSAITANACQFPQTSQFDQPIYFEYLTEYVIHVPLRSAMSGISLGSSFTLSDQTILPSHDARVADPR
jgi:hypothetical protein